MPTDHHDSSYEGLIARNREDILEVVRKHTETIG